MQLKRINSAIDRVGRNDINENFDILERAYGKTAIDAQTAKEQSFTANEMAETALETSDEAKQKAESVQNQFNQVVIEGDSSVEAAQARVGADATTYDTLKERLDAENAQFTQQLAQIEIDPKFKASSSTESAALGGEIITSSGWIVPSGWAGDFANGFQNTVGNTNPLTFTMPVATGTKLYQVVFYVQSPTPAGVPNASTDFVITLGNSEPFVTYNGGGSKTYTFGIRSVSDGNLVFTPGATFDGKIMNVSVKEIVGEVSPSLEIVSVIDAKVLEIRGTKANLNNLFIGKDSGKKNTTGNGNATLGDFSLVSNTTGYWNSALGREALRDNTTGSRNVALGYLALEQNISGDRNIAIGTFALERNTHGRQNLALGADCLWVNTTGSRNIGMGMGTLGSNTVGNENVAIGYAAMEANIDGNNNVAIGFNALYDNKNGSTNIAIGRETLKKNLASHNIGIGLGTVGWNTTGISNVAVGNQALSRSSLGSENAVFGHYAAGSGAYGDGISQSTIVGAWAGNRLTTGGNNNTLIGYAAGRELTTGTSNIIIGRNAGQNLITESNRLVIGDLLYGTLNTSAKKFGIGVVEPSATLHLKASTGGVGTAPIKLESGALLTARENGTLEFDGTNLYFTVGGVRKIFQFTS